MTDKWTPGPWRADLHHTRESGSRIYGFILSTSIVVPIAVVPIGVDRRPAAEGRANTYLLAVAPEMVALLREWVEPWTDLSDEQLRSNTRCHQEALRNRILATRALLAKLETE